MWKDTDEEYLDAFIGVLAGVHRPCNEATEKYFPGNNVTSDISNYIKSL